ncbi:hypothetical protein TMPK1_07220 [Rhodospirillales bacterium TMPK1]|uniref:Uncharacterized protein n=2 Tax=Roseiterribacter gracilis TaxID=2812848 RepID=A0A8S8XB01_9PROT|nr:hypothetical protein TMPK1_07220 [Rhodospirillales bacterium TMPK1]
MLDKGLPNRNTGGMAKAQAAIAREKPREKTESDPLIVREGAASAERGAGRSSNPYRDHIARTAWFEGYDSWLDAVAAKRKRLSPFRA